MQLFAHFPPTLTEQERIKREPKWKSLWVNTKVVSLAKLCLPAKQWQMYSLLPHGGQMSSGFLENKASEWVTVTGEDERDVVRHGAPLGSAVLAACPPSSSSTSAHCWVAKQSGEQQKPSTLPAVLNKHWHFIKTVRSCRSKTQHHEGCSEEC